MIKGWGCFCSILVFLFPREHNIDYFKYIFLKINHSCLIYIHPYTYNKTEGVIGISTVFSKQLQQLTSLTVYISFQFLHILRAAAFCISITALIAGSKWNLTVVLGCISLKNNKDWAINHIPAEDLYILFWEMPIQVFFNLIWLILDTYEDFPYIL